MNLVINFTQSQQFQVAQLQSLQDINQITFIVPIFIFFQNNFKLLYNYASFLIQRPLIKTNIETIATEDEIKQLQLYSVVLVRGTFDHLHLGHQVLLLKALYSASHRLIVQVKDDSILNNKKLKELLQPLDVRKENIRNFLEGLKPQVQVKIQVITEVYGSAPYTKGIDAIAMTEESSHSLNHINKLRKSNNGFKNVHRILSPLLTQITNNLSTTKQQRIDLKLSSQRTREYLLKENNFTVSQFLEYRAIWDSLVKEINSLCRVKDIDFMVAEKWWERILYKHSRKTQRVLGKRVVKNNREIYLEISKQNNASTPNQHSLHEIATNLALLFDGVQEEEKNLNAIVRSFLDGLLKKKGKSKTCKKIRKMIMNDIKEFVHKTHPKKIDLNKNTLQNQTAVPQQINEMLTNHTFEEEAITNITPNTLENLTVKQQSPLINEQLFVRNDTQQF